MSDPVRPIDPLTAAAAAFGAPSPASAPAQIETPDAFAPLLVATTLAVTVEPRDGLDTLILGTPAVPVNPAIPELIAARARLLLREEEQPSEALTSDAWTDPPVYPAPERDDQSPPHERDEEPDANAS